MNNEIELYNRLESIGLNVNTNGRPYLYTDIEKTLVLAMNEIPKDQRILGLLLSWVLVHGEKVNIERLDKLLKLSPTNWSGLIALFAVYCKQSRWKKLIRKPEKVTSNGNLKANKSRIKLRGEEEWSKNSGFLIPKNSEAIGEKFVLSVSQLAKINKHYRNKLMYGANWRADIITAIESGAKNPHQAAKICHSSYEPAHRIFSDYMIAKNINSAA